MHWHLNYVSNNSFYHVHRWSQQKPLDNTKLDPCPHMEVWAKLFLENRNSTRLQGEVEVWEMGCDHLSFPHQDLMFIWAKEKRFCMTMLVWTKDIGISHQVLSCRYFFTQTLPIIFAFLDLFHVLLGVSRYEFPWIQSCSILNELTWWQPNFKFQVLSFNNKAYSLSHMLAPLLLVDRRCLANEMLGDTRQRVAHFGEFNYASPDWWHLEVCN